ncbi:MAG: TetR/AcrR family transcriptional regulator [Scytolyngbya sp. HA4215-MV1]|jgi:AcrR family transcriptional regulator|nr:TetR/AcrR family transcriptional regulator [Scytolyngbya sp. HA4215-MV1]
MGKPTSSLTTAISIRIPNELLDAVADYAESQGLINQSGRLDKRGQPNLSAAVSDLLKQALEQSDSNAGKLSDSVSSLQNQPLKVELADMENRLIDRVRDAVAQQLHQFLEQYNIANDSVEETNDLAESNGDTNSALEKEDTKDRILQAASRGFRSLGYNGIGVNTLAKDAGVTSGAFYGYFRSKEDAFLATVVDGLAEYRANIKAFQADYGADWVVALADYYMGRKHRLDLACGCALPTLSPEVIRADRRVRSAYQTGLLKLNNAIASGLIPGTAVEKQSTAWVILSVLVGGLTLARAVWDEAISEQISTAVHDVAITLASGCFDTAQVSFYSNQHELDSQH